MANYDGKRFQNRIASERSGRDLFNFIIDFQFNKTPWPDTVTSNSQSLPPIKPGEISVTFINHATVLIRLNDTVILTDPIYSDRCSPLSFAGPKRVRQPGIHFDDLPPIDVILISHNHYDHLDIPTLKRLTDKQPGHPPLIIAGLGVDKLLHDHGLTHTQVLNWDEGTSVNTLTVRFSEARHRSGRGLWDQQCTLWGSFIIETPLGNLYFAGDTGYGPHFKEAGETYGPFKLALLPIGAYEPRFFMSEVHLNPADAVKAHRDLKSHFSMGIHFGTFQLTMEGIDQPAQDLKRALEKHNLNSEFFIVPQFGETISISPASVVTKLE